MNKINRAVVKAQARQILKGKWFLLFVVSIIVLALTQTGTVISKDISSLTNPISQITGAVDNIKDGKDDEISDFESFDGISDFEAFGNDANDINSFDYSQFFNNDSEIYSQNNQLDSPKSNFVTRLSAPLNLISIIFTPLIVTLTGIYLMLIRKPDEEFILGNNIVAVFKNSFNETYLKKLILVLLRDLFTVLLAVLFVIPGIVYHYSTYFSYQILNDNPDMTPREACKLSRKMVEGHRGELFVLDLSFILWYLLVGITCGIASIYVIPYVMTTEALYYENFRIRALQSGVIRETDFKANETQPAYDVHPQQDNYFSYATPQNDANGYFYNPASPQENTETTPAEMTAPEPITEVNGEVENAEQNSYYTPPADYYTPSNDNQE